MSDLSDLVRHLDRIATALEQIAAQGSNPDRNQTAAPGQKNQQQVQTAKERDGLIRHGAKLGLDAPAIHKMIKAAGYHVSLGAVQQVMKLANRDHSLLTKVRVLFPEDIPSGYQIRTALGVRYETAERLKAQLREERSA